jgi:MFS family permease
MAFTNLAVFGGAFFTPILVGKITHTLMWWWTFNLVAIFCAACLPLIYFFVPETAYRRNASLNTDMLATSSTALNDKDQHAEPADRERGTSSDKALADSHNGTAAPRPAEIPKKHSFRQSLAIFTGRKSDETFWKLLFRPFPLFLQPAFLWACLIQGTMIGWTVFIGVIMAQFFLGYPLWWDEVRTGYAYVGAFIGAILGFVIAGGLADWSAKKLTQWNKGVYEPEFRIVLVIPQMILGCMGLYGFGITADGLLVNKYHYAVPLTFFALEVAGMVIGAVASSLYIVDAYRKLLCHWSLMMVRLL